MWVLKIRIHKVPIPIRNSTQPPMDRTSRTLRTTITSRVKTSLAREETRRSLTTQASREEVTEQMGHKNTTEMETKQRIRGHTSLRISSRKTLLTRNRVALSLKSMRREWCIIQIRCLQWRISRSSFLRVIEKRK